jgi:hypothetical protein
LLLAVCAAGVCAGFISVRADDSPAQAAARAALEQKMRELDVQQQPQTNDLLVESNAVVVVPPQPAPAMAAPAAPQPAMTPPPRGSGLFVPATPTPPSDTEAQTAAQAAFEQSMAGSNQGETAAQPAASQIQPAPFTPSPETSGTSGAGKEPGFQPIVAPPLPISAGKQAQLEALNARYLADQITPEEYFKQRAQILAAP